MKHFLFLTMNFWLLSTLFAFLLFGYAVPAQALLQEHLNQDGCNTCHSLHASPGGTALLIGADSTLTCLACHGPSGMSSLKATIHNLNGGEVICAECHNGHNNDRLNAVGSTNEKLVGIEIDYNNDPILTLSSPQIRRERVATGLGALQEVVFVVGPDDWERTEIDDSGDGLGVCNACHDNIHNRDQDCTSCHAHDGGFTGAGDCRACHDGTGLSAAEKVSVDSPHSTNTIFGSTGETFTCENCHTGHLAGNVQVPNNSTVGITYSTAGHNGISLGADDGKTNDAVGTTEAEICWNCHDVFGVSEWGVNTDTNGTGTNYDFGSLSQSNWVGASWNSANGQTDTDPFWYKRGAIQSTHAVDGSATVPGLDPVENIRCSYCHDVHELNSLASDNSSGKPYLRGTWKGNTYLEDGVPQLKAVYADHRPGHTVGGTATPSGGFGAVPRPSISVNTLGGYQIDQNNGNPTTGGTPAHNNPVSAAWSLANNAGLCVMCHSEGVDNLNKFGTDSDAWVGTNGHANAAIGGTGTASLKAANIFSVVIRNPGETGSLAVTGNFVNKDKPVMAYRGQGGTPDVRMGGFRGSDGKAYGFLPPSAGAQGFSYEAYDWGATIDFDPTGTETTDDQYHKFSCSKCHNPHASRLPRLLITNCLDTKQNTWDDVAGSVTPVGTVGGYNQNTTLSNVSSAQNCHRLRDPAFLNAGGDGWNLVTPWNSGGQDNPGIP